MNNQDIARVLFDIADFLEAQEVPFKPRAYRQAAEFVERASENIVKVYNHGGVKALDALPAIGKNIAKKTGELVDTGKLKYLERLKRKLPVEMGELTAIEGVGPKTVKALYEQLGVRTLEDLEQAVIHHKIRSITGFREKAEQNIGKGIELLRKLSDRRPLRAVLPVAERIVQSLQSVDGIRHAEAAGSIRRREPTIGDIDIVACSTAPQRAIDAFISFPDVGHVYSKGDTKALVRLKQGLDADLRVVEPASYGSALQYFTGDKAHSIATRKLAQSRGMKLNEYGLFKGRKKVAGRSEKGIYKRLGLPYIEPEDRTGTLPQVGT